MRFIHRQLNIPRVRPIDLCGLPSGAPMNEGIAAIQARIASIEAFVGVRNGQASSTSTSSGGAASGSSASSATDFASLLQQAQADQVANTDTSKYQNGRIPDSALASIGGGHKLTATAAKSFLQLRADAQRAGVNIGVNDSYRSYDEQVKMAKEKGLYSQGGLAAKPGTSDHGLGKALDLQLDAKAQQWMKQNAKNYGFVNNVAGESWHWTYKP
jgi:D-alanyl-D-alanine carboxypeptidase